MSSLANIYHHQSQYDKALPLYTTCLERKKSILGENHPHTLTSMNNLAMLYKNQGQYDKALTLIVIELVLPTY
jgi:tetratricopeptide (TPR) repeat protein